MADTEAADYRAQVEEAERSLVAALQAAAEGECADGIVASDPEAPLYRLAGEVRALIARLDAVSRDRERLHTELSAQRSSSVAPGDASEAALPIAYGADAGEGRVDRPGPRDTTVEFAVLYELGRSLSAQLGLAEVLNETFEGVSRLVDASNFYIGLLDRDRNQVDISLNVTESVVDEHITVIGADEGLTGHVLRTGESLLVGEDVAGWLADHDIGAVGEPAQCWLGVPLVVGDEVQGIMAVQDYRTPHAFNETDRDLLAAIAAQASIAIQNARLFSELERRARYEQALRELTARVRGATDADAVLRVAVQTLGSALGRRAFVRLGESSVMVDAYPGAEREEQDA